MHKRFGRKPWREMLEPAVRLAERGDQQEGQEGQSGGEATHDSTPAKDTGPQLRPLAAFYASGSLFGNGFYRN